jgi:FlaG/FlaF family flagellin (archaellin)
MISSRARRQGRRRGATFIEYGILGAIACGIGVAIMSILNGSLFGEAASGSGKAHKIAVTTTTVAKIVKGAQLGSATAQVTTSFEKVMAPVAGVVIVLIAIVFVLKAIRFVVTGGRSTSSGHAGKANAYSSEGFSSRVAERPSRGDDIWQAHAKNLATMQASSQHDSQPDSQTDSQTKGAAGSPRGAYTSSGAVETAGVATLEGYGALTHQDSSASDHADGAVVSSTAGPGRTHQFVGPAAKRRKRTVGTPKFR